ncbi:hypothetical protein WAE56_11185 [Iodobacter sp. LRB]|uniref:hypothetical protein n=1 Tax=unclassified Iodobacter TaxID=235634 RepID=UPI000C0F53C1|nr:hypothetical protein [Iodobacter sp. BJB302]PHV02768.1 hypothetical protein CSQ88_04985 [Iodobacter sp. BJB302]
MRKSSLICVLTLLLSSPAVFADCKDMIKETRQDIEDNRDHYTLAARNKARVDLAKAEANLLDLNPLPDVDCRKSVLKARAELRKGKK